MDLIIKKIKCDITILNAKAMDIRENADKMWFIINNNIGESPEYRPPKYLLLGWTLEKYLPVLELEDDYNMMQKDIKILYASLRMYKNEFY